MEKSSIRNKEFILPAVILFIIVLCGLYVRVNGLSTLGLGFDEPTHIYAAKSILETGEPALPSGFEYRRALPFTYAVAISFKLFGISELSARLPSVISGTLSIILIFFIGKSFFGTTVGLTSALLLAFIPFEIVWSRTCRMYAMYQFFFLLGFFTFYKGFESENTGNSKPELTRNNLLTRIPIVSSWNLSWRWLFLSGILLLVAFTLQIQVLVFGASILLYLLSMSFITMITKGYKQTLRSKYLSFFLLFLICALVAFLIIPDVSARVKGAYNFYPEWGTYVKSNSPTKYFNFLVSQNLFPIMAFFILGGIQACIRGSKPGFYSLVCVCVPLFIHSFLVQLRQPRYIYDIFPLILLLSSYAIYNVFSYEFRALYLNLRRNFRFNLQYESIKRLLPIFAVLLLILFFLPLSPGFRNSNRITGAQSASFGGEYNSDWKGACDYLRKSHQKGDVIIASIPLAADFYECGQVEYMLNNGEIDQFREPDSNGFMLDIFSDSKAIVNLDDLKKALLSNPRGWIVSNIERFNSPASTPDEVRNFIINNLEHHFTQADDTMFIFEWDSDHSNY